MKKNKLLAIFLLLSEIIFSQSWQMVQILSPIKNDDSPPLLDGSFFNDTGIVMSSYGQLVHTTDFFDSFWIDSIYIGNDFSAISFCDHDTGYISSSSVQGRMLKSVDGGNAWQPITNAAPSTYLGQLFLFVSPDTGFGAFINDNLFNYTFNGGLNWVEAVINPPYYCGCIYRFIYKNETVFALCNEAQELYLPGYLNIMQSNDYGASWSLYRATNIISEYADFYFVDDSTILLVTDQMIYRSTNSGLSFDTVMVSGSAGLSTYQHCFSFVNHDTGFVATFLAVFKTYDAGATWQQTDFTFDSNDYENQIEFIKAISSQKVIIGCEHGNLYKTTTGGGVAAGITEVKTEPTMTVFPNPVSNTLFFKNQLVGKNYSVTVFSIYGQEIYSTRDYVTSIDVSGFPAGVYILQYKADNYIGNAKFIKQ